MRAGDLRAALQAHRNAAISRARRAFSQSRHKNRYHAYANLISRAALTSKIQKIGLQMIRRIAALILAFCLALPQAIAPVWAAATLLPNGEQCFSATTSTSGASGTGNGFVGTLGTITPGTGGTAGTYGGVALTGGSGTGATANITVSAGGVTAVAILNPGTQYVVGDVLSAASATIGNTTGFSVPVNSVSINSALAGGFVFMYQPGTTTFKSTWFNSDQASGHQNTNPVKLDVNGCAIIYGTGSYQQVLQDSLGNTIWSQITTDTSANNNTFWAGVAGGTPNAITVTDAGFNGTDGSIVNFTPIASNTGPTTFNLSNFFGGSPPSIVKDTSTGPVALSGGEIAIAAGGNANIVSLQYSASQNNFHILNLISATASASSPLCGAVGLKIINDVTFPNSKMVITADQVVMQNTQGQYLTRGSPTAPISVSVNYTTTGANGFDGANGTSFQASSFYNNYVIDNGIAPAGLGSVSATAPTMPSGYTYRCRLSASETDGSGNFYRILTLGPTTRLTSTTATAELRLITGLGSGSAWTQQSLASFIPPTATQVTLAVQAAFGTSGGIAPNANYGTPASTTNPPPLSWGSTANTPSGFNNVQVGLQLETQAFYYWSNSTANQAFLYGWTDKVNAN